MTPRLAERPFKNNFDSRFIIFYRLRRGQGQFINSDTLVRVRNLNRQTITHPLLTQLLTRLDEKHT